VVSTTNATSPISSGNQAPWASFVRLAAKNSRSTAPKKVAPAITTHHGCRHW
jgi:hypothetical protein